VDGKSVVGRRHRTGGILQSRGGGPPEAHRCERAFLLMDLAPGEHIVELQAQCYLAKKFSIESKFFNPPFQDYPPFEPFKLEPSKGLLTVTSAWEAASFSWAAPRRHFAGEGPLGVRRPYALEVRFPSGGFAQSIVIEKDKAFHWP